MALEVGALLQASSPFLKKSDHFKSRLNWVGHQQRPHEQGGRGKLLPRAKTQKQQPQIGRDVGKRKLCDD